MSQPVTTVTKAVHLGPPQPFVTGPLLVDVDSSGGAYTITLPDATTFYGNEVVLTKVTSDTNAVTVQAQSGQTINGATATQSLTGRGDSLRFTTSGGTDWRMTGSLLQSATDAAWTTATLTNSWTNLGSGFASAGYRKVNGRIYLRGAIVPGTLSSAAFTLPAGYRPAYTLDFAVDSSPNGNVGRVQIGTAGTVTPIYGTSYLMLDVISFDLLA